MLTMNFTYRIYPDAIQQQLMQSWLETCRFVYNRALRELKDWIASRKSLLLSVFAGEGIYNSSQYPVS
ncbi:helix-turn-helix domain-containing protein [Scytonema sp. HK-05]|uniref:helix-turn-helix domain-containing protein n=1 Tax=Scytonema sp. HK-05 TaxID=1137095 RepID=UPI0030DBE681